MKRLLRADDDADPSDNKNITNKKTRHPQPVWSMAFYYWEGLKNITIQEP
jgi:hypothetical protein